MIGRAGCRRLHEASLQILEHTGVRLDDPEALAPDAPERFRAWGGAQRWPELVGLVASRKAQAPLGASVR